MNKILVKKAILEQKKEKEILLLKTYIPRQNLEKAKEYLNSSLVKVVLGPRRAGKSVFCLLLLKDTNFAYLNFDDEDLLKNIMQDDLIQLIAEIYDDPKILLFDEIQNLKNWELFVNKLQRRGKNIVLTGSNSNLLSQELASHLTGRYAQFEVLPFSFKEFLQAKGKVNLNPLVSEEKGVMLNLLSLYIKCGGFPEVVTTNLDPAPYLQTLFDAALLKDVVKRHNIRLLQNIYDLSFFLASNFACEISARKIKNSLGFASTTTVLTHLKYLEQAYLCLILNRFSYKVREQIKSPKKVYLVDSGYSLVKSFRFSENFGRLIENLVFVTLLRMGHKPNFSLFYYKTRNSKEVDFVLKTQEKVQELIQVWWEQQEGNSKNREIKALLEASGELNCENLKVITWDYEKKEHFNGKIVEFIPLFKWLLA